MELHFHKYQGTGNDFIILDNRKGRLGNLGEERIRKMCDRRFGIGADGLMLLNEKEGYDFEMIYYNSDGRPGSMCGNGGRCLVKFAHQLGLHREQFRFLAVDGDHNAEIDIIDWIVSLQMKDVEVIQEYKNDRVLNTGSPHYIREVKDVESMDVFTSGRQIRYSPDFEGNGINVNFVQKLDRPGKIKMRTYERGVEDETLSCGTGVVAAALVNYHNPEGFNEVEVFTRGGRLTVEFDRLSGNYYNVWLCGPAEKVYEGDYTY